MELTKNLLFTILEHGGSLSLLTSDLKHPKLLKFSRSKFFNLMARSFLKLLAIFHKLAVLKPFRGGMLDYSARL